MPPNKDKSAAAAQDDAKGGDTNILALAKELQKHVNALQAAKKKGEKKQAEVETLEGEAYGALHNLMWLRKVVDDVVGGGEGSGLAAMEGIGRERGYRAFQMLKLVDEQLKKEPRERLNPAELERRARDMPSD